jgi:predicted dehydrogenase
MIRAIVIGIGNMGLSHAMALHKAQGVEIVALVNRSSRTLPEELKGYPLLDSVEVALTHSPDLVVIATYSDSHCKLAIRALESGAHVFVEKPLATTVPEARRVIETASRLNRKLVVGYILRHHPSWQRFIHEARGLNGPYVFRMNLNQQSFGREWATHCALMQSTSPLVDCGVHYVDVMCQITDAAPVQVQAIGLRLTNDIPDEMYNYGQLQVQFSDGSVGWYEAGWGPMMSQTAYFVKDVISPTGSVSIVDAESANSSEIDGHTKVGSLLVHRLEGDQRITLIDEPSHQELCNLEQAFVIRTIEDDIDLSRHMHDAVQSLEICIAADTSIRTGQPVKL